MPKFFEVRDRMTFIPVMASKLFAESITAQEGWLIRRAGYDYQFDFIVTHLLSGESCNDAFKWREKHIGRTMFEAHRYIQEHWSELKGGEVIDIEFVLGESSEKKRSENEWN